VKKPLILIGLNEINFDVVRRYLASGAGNFPALRRIQSCHEVRTSCEDRYELLEPWIQWPSVQTGLSYDQHQLFRLGDVVESNVRQIFEDLEARGLQVGAISPMNAANRLARPAYFIPDPWTLTKPDDSWWSRKLHAAISQAVNDNAQSRLSPTNVFYLLCGLARFARPQNYALYLRLAAGARKAPWRKALFLDLFLHDLHMGLMASSKPDFSLIFLNAGAHIQHHYFLNAAPLRGSSKMRNPDWYASPTVDPVAEMLSVYDRIVGDYLQLAGAEKIFATGLSQIPYDRVKFYYRLRDHRAFLRTLGIPFQSVSPRMTRDFLIEFPNSISAKDAEEKLRRVSVIAGDRRVPLFEEIDNRGSSLFVTLTYPDEIDSRVEVEFDGRRWSLAPLVAFVAVKNGMHQADGFAYFSEGIADLAPESGSHVKALHESVLKYFGGTGGQS
jgi:hypothetical protein